MAESVSAAAVGPRRFMDDPGRSASRLPRPYLFRRPLLLIFAAYALALPVVRLWLGEPRPSSADAAHFASGGVFTLEGRVAEIPGPLKDEFRFLLKAESLAGEGGAAAAAGLVSVRVQDRNFSARWGDKVRLSGWFARPRPASGPGAFDSRAWLGRRGVHSSLSVPPGGWIVLERAPAWFPGRWISVLRENFSRTLRERMSPHAAALLSGLILGEKPSAFPDMDRDFRRSGTYHLLVASGSNVGFVAALWFLAARWIFFLPRRAVWLGAIPCAFLYAGLAGADPPVVRAAVMISLGIAAYLLAREDRLEYAVLLSAGLLLLARPQALFEAGFQMSYAATLGIAAGAPALAFLARRGGAAGRWLLNLALVSLCAQAALAPVLLHYFHRFSWIGVAANLVCVPWAALCLALGAALFLGGLFFPGADGLLNALAYLPEKAALGLWAAVAAFARVPGAEWTPAWSGRQTALLSALVAASFLALAGRRPSRLQEAEGKVPDVRRGWLFLAALWTAGIPLLRAAGGPPPGRGELSAVWTDAGQGDAIVVTGPGGRVTLVDAGGAASARRNLVSYLRSRAAARVDRVLLTHGDPPHAGGLSVLAQEFPPVEFLCSRETWADPAWEDERADLLAAGVSPRFLAPGDSWEEDGASWLVYDAGGEAGRRALAFSVALNGGAALFTADMASEAQAALARQLTGPVSVLHWPRHGRASLEPSLMARARPQWVVVSGGPAARAAPSTARDGPFEWRTDGTSPRLRFLSEAPPDVFRLFPAGTAAPQDGPPRRL